MSAQGAVVMPVVREIPFDVRHLVRALLLSLSTYAFFMAWAVLLARTGVADKVSLAIAHAGGALALFVCWRLGRWGRARFDSFGAALLLFGVAFRVLAALDTLFFDTRVEAIYRYRTVPVSDPVIDILLKGEFITVVGMMLVACSWRFGIGARIDQFTFIGNIRPVLPRLPILIYTGALCVDVATRIFAFDFGPLQQILWLTFTFGVAAIYFLAARSVTPARQILVAVILALPMFALALTSGMKEQMFFPFIPAAILYWTRFRHPLARAAAIFLGLLLFGLSQLYVHYVRETTWRSTGDLQVSSGELVQGFGTRVDTMEHLDLINASGSRINQTITHAVTVTLADQRGYEPAEVFGLIPASFIPRALWPNKPVIQPGAMHTMRIYGGNIHISQIRSATAAGFWTELYLGGWWWGVVLGSAAYGLLLASAQNWALRYEPGFGHQALCFLVLYSTVRFDELHVVYAYASIVFTVVFVWMLGQAVRLMGLGTTEDMAGGRSGATGARRG